MVETIFFIALVGLVTLFLVGLALVIKATELNTELTMEDVYGVGEPRGSI